MINRSTDFGNKTTVTFKRFNLASWTKSIQKQLKHNEIGKNSSTKSLGRNGEEANGLRSKTWTISSMTKNTASTNMCCPNLIDQQLKVIIS